jgi:hypothetical protein
MNLNSLCAAYDSRNHIECHNKEPTNMGSNANAHVAQDPPRNETRPSDVGLDCLGGHD